MLWIGGLMVYLGLSGFLPAELGRGRLELTLRCSPRCRRRCSCSGAAEVLSANRLARQDLIPFVVLGAALLALCSVGAAVYAPHLFNSYTTRYGVIGAVFSIVLFCMMVVVVGSAATGREVRDELDRIRRGERPAGDKVRRQWDQVTAEARSRWETGRVKIQERRHRRHGG